MFTIKAKNNYMLIVPLSPYFSIAFREVFNSIDINISLHFYPLGLFGGLILLIDLKRRV